MSYLALYRKYRPNNFKDLVGQSEIANIILNEIINNKISHAYLFSGPRGTGKTSTAKIIAKMINCENLSSDGIPCGKCISCVNFESSNDVVEIDAASNNGVDEIRDLRDKVNLVPSYGRYKVYIIDEVHMLTTQAFNALLKTLEEPPSHIIFILATTEFYKIPATVVSRCQKFQFSRFSNEDIVDRLSSICDFENINVSNDILFEIARLADGGMRDAINMLDQLSSFKTNDLSLDDVYQLCGVISFKEYSNLLHYFYNNDISSIVSFINDIDRKGKNFDRFLQDFTDFLKDILVFYSTNSVENSFAEKNISVEECSKLFDFSTIYNILVSLNDLSIRLKNSNFSKVLLVTEFIKICNDINVKNVKNVDTNKNNYLVDNTKNINNSNDSIKKYTIELPKISDKEKMIRVNNAFATASKERKEKFLSKWFLVNEKVSDNSDYVTIASMINDIEAMVVGEKNIIFVAQYDSLIERLFLQIDIIEKLLYDIFGVQYDIIFLLKDEWNYEKEKYISSLKSGKKYVLIEDNQDISHHDSDVDKIVSILGKDVVSYE